MNGIRFHAPGDSAETFALEAVRAQSSGGRDQEVLIQVKGGLAHLGVLSVLRKAGIPIRAISGSSMGAIVGTLVSLDPDFDLAALTVLVSALFTLSILPALLFWVKPRFLRRAMEAGEETEKAKELPGIGWQPASE